MKMRLALGIGLTVAALLTCYAQPRETPEVQRGVSPAEGDATEVAMAADPAYAAIEGAVGEARRENGRLTRRLADRVSVLDFRELVESRGGTNIWTRAIQKALDSHEVVLIPASERPYCVDAPLVVPSNRRIEAKGARISLADGVRTILLRNASVRDGTLAPIPAGTRDDNITIEGGSWEDWHASRAGYGNSGTFHADRRGEKGDFYGVSTLFLFENCNHVTVRDATFVKCSGFAVQAGGGDALVFERIRFDDCYADGIHLNGNLSRVHCRDVRGKVGDDLVAMNAYDWHNSSIDFGPQRFVLCEDLELVLKDGRGYPAIRIQPAKYRYADGSIVDCAISDVIFRRVKGIRTFKMYLQTPQYLIGRNGREWADTGSGGNIYFENLDIDLTEPIDNMGAYAASDPVRGHFGAFELGANLSAVTIRDSDVTLHADAWPQTHLVTVGPKSSPYVTKRGNRMEIFDPYVSCTVGTVTVENVRFRGRLPERLVHAVEFRDVNGDGDSSGAGRIMSCRIR